MSDQFSEWDRFWEQYKRTLGKPAKSLRRYRKQRMKEENTRSVLEMLRTIEMKKASSSLSWENSQEEGSSETSTSPG